MVISKEIFSETASKSREIAAEATKQADLLAGQIKHLAARYRCFRGWV
jgi:hypothetical protein